MTDEFIAVDWGTTNRRCYVVDPVGTVSEVKQDEGGILAIEPDSFANEAAIIRERHGNRPLLMAGMIGSDRGWVEVPYVGCPVGIEDLARAAAWIVPGQIAIVPGVSDTAAGRADVMRGEEVQFLGAVAAGLVPADALLCQPGTHCKWARMEAGRIAGFTTTLTGELFALLAKHSLLAPQIGDSVAADSNFLAGIEQARQGDILASLFSVRAAAALGKDAGPGASFISGLLIGADVAARPGVAGSEVYVLAEPKLGDLYSFAIEACGGSARLVDSREAFVAGMLQIWRELS